MISLTFAADLFRCRDVATYDFAEIVYEAHLEVAQRGLLPRPGGLQEIAKP